MVHGYKVFCHIRSILGWCQSVLAVLPYNPLLRSDLLQSGASDRSLGFEDEDLGSSMGGGPLL